jgi:broad specificity phosphatase PhoE
VAEVLSSPYCRCIDTAKLAFGKATAVQDLEFAISKPQAEAQRLGAALRKLLENKPPRGTNTVVVAHTANLKEAAGIWPKAEGDAIIFRPKENGGFLHVGSVRAEEWAELAKSN